jgi:hypothetical protein
MGWPWVTPLLAAGLIAVSWLEARPAGSRPRWTDPVFLLPLLWPMYLLHQFEEHGYDFQGHRFAFLGSMCRTLGFDQIAGCPADAPFVFAVNVLACPVAFSLTYMFRRSRPLLAVVPWGIPLVNAVAHLGAAVREGAYNPGLVTSLILFIPLTLWVIAVLLRSRVLRPVHLVWVVLSGVAVHAVLLGSVQLRAHGIVGSGGLFLINALNGLTPLLVGGWAPRGRGGELGT